MEEEPDVKDEKEKLRKAIEETEDTEKEIKETLKRLESERKLRRTSILSEYHPSPKFGKVAGMRRFRPFVGLMEKIQQKPSKRAGEAPGRPLLTAAVNQGKRWLNRKGQELYNTEFLSILQEFSEKSKILNEKARRKKEIEIELKQLAAEEKGRVKKVGGSAEGFGGEVEFQEEKTKREALLRELDSIDKDLRAYEKEFKDTLTRASAKLRKLLKDYASDIATILARRYKLPLESKDEQTLRAELNYYAIELAEDLVTRGMSKYARFIRGLRTISRSGMTVYDIWEDFKHWLRELITGPLILGAILILILYWMTVAYVGVLYGVPFGLVLFVAGATAVLNLLFNFEKTEAPLDILYHFISGGIIGFDAALLMISFGVLIGEPTISLGFFILGVAILVFLGIFQVYYKGEFYALVPVTVIIILLSYAVLGPYGGVTRHYVEAVKEPLRIVWLSVKEGFQSAWLLATNPTEWYAQQQKRNVQPEYPVAFPQGLEVTRLDAMPSSVPRNQYFIVAGLIENKGDQKARNITIEGDCNIYCMEPKKKDGTLNNKIENIPDLEKGAGYTFRFEKFLATGSPRNYAEVTVKVTYSYSTSSSLLTKVMTQDEIMRRQVAGEDVFKQVAAVGKVGPAQISLNVGPQPLEASKDERNIAPLLVSVVNTRRELANVILPKGTRIIVRVPHTIGRVKSCTGLGLTRVPGTVDESRIPELDSGIYESNNMDIINYILQRKVVIKPMEANTIFSFVCDIEMISEDELKNMGTESLTDLITAEMPSYQYQVQRKASTFISEPLGIVSTCGSYGGVCVNPTEDGGCPQGGELKVEGTCTVAGRICCVLGKEITPQGDYVTWSRIPDKVTALVFGPLKIKMLGIGTIGPKDIEADLRISISKQAVGGAPNGFKDDGSGNYYIDVEVNNEVNRFSLMIDNKPLTIELLDYDAKQPVWVSLRMTSPWIPKEFNGLEFSGGGGPDIPKLATVTKYNIPDRRYEMKINDNLTVIGRGIGTAGRKDIEAEFDVYVNGEKQDCAAGVSSAMQVSEVGGQEEATCTTPYGDVTITLIGYDPEDPVSVDIMITSPLITKSCESGFECVANREACENKCNQLNQTMVETSYEENCIIGLPLNDYCCQCKEE